MSECRCDFRTRLLGDGCPICNPEFWKKQEEMWAEQDARYRLPPCLECGANTPEEAEKLCRCGGDKDSCHGCDLWPD